MNVASIPLLSLRNIRGETYLDAPWLSFDLETTNVHGGDARFPENRIVCGAWQRSTDKEASTFYGDVYQHDPFLQAREDVLSAGGFLVAHNCKFEAHWDLRNGIEAALFLWYDPMLGEWTLLGNNPRRQRLALETVAPKYGAPGKDPFIAALMEAGVCPSIMPRSYLLARCKRDVESTSHSMLRQLVLLKERQQLHLAAQRCLFAPVLADIERSRIGLDSDRVLAEHAAFTAKYAALKADSDALTGGTPEKPFSERSPLQLIPFLYGIHPHVEPPKPKKPRKKKAKKGEPEPSIHEWLATAEQQAEAERCKCPRCSPERQAELKAASLGFDEPTDARGKPKRLAVSKSWPDGRPKTDKHTIAALARKATTERAKRWLALKQEMAHVYFALSKNLDFYKGVVLEQGGSFLASLRQGVTATHRLGGQGVPSTFDCIRDDKGKPRTLSAQGQNTPREFKKLQRAQRPGHKMASADGKQLEFRFAVFLGQDPKGMADIRNPDFDAHLQTLTVMLNGAFNQAVYDDLHARYKAGDKHVKWQRNDNALCKSHTYKPLFGGERGTPEQERYYAWFFENYAGIEKTMRGWLKTVTDSALRNSKTNPVTQCQEGTGSFRAPSGLVFTYDLEFRQRRNGEMVAYDRRTKKPVKPSIYNHPVQEISTGEAMPIAVVCLYHRVKKDKLRAVLTNTVHDSADAEVHEQDWPQYAHHATRAFTDDVKQWLQDAYGINVNVPLGADVSFGEFLGEGETVSYDTQ